MNWQKYKWFIVVITIVLTFGILSGSNFFHQQYVIDKPLTKALETIDGVEAITWDTSNKIVATRTIDITLNNVTNLQSTYQEINNSASNVLGPKKYKIMIHDHRTPELEQFYYSIHYHIHEAIFTGKFSTMAQFIEEKALATNIKPQIYIDSQNIYLQLTSTTGNLYMVISRQPYSPEVK